MGDHRPTFQQWPSGLTEQRDRKVQKSAKKVSNELGSASAHLQLWLQVGLHGQEGWRWQHIRLATHSPAQTSKALTPIPNPHKLYPNPVLTGSAGLPSSLMGVSLTPVFLFCPLTGHNLCLTDFLRNQVQDFMLLSLANRTGPLYASGPSKDCTTQPRGSEPSLCPHRSAAAAAPGPFQHLPSGWHGWFVSGKAPG